MKTFKNIFTIAVILIFNLTASFGQSTKNYVSKSPYKSGNSSSYSTPSYNTNLNARYQPGYTKSNGTYVRPHYKSKSNSTNRDNYSTQGNYNPYTGKKGTGARDYSSGARNYGKGKTIHTGPRGGQYYINSRGNKTYVPKQ